MLGLVPTGLSIPGQYIVDVVTPMKLRPTIHMVTGKDTTDMLVVGQDMKNLHGVHALHMNGHIPMSLELHILILALAILEAKPVTIHGEIFTPLLHYMVKIYLRNFQSKELMV